MGFPQIPRTLLILLLMFAAASAAVGQDVGKDDGHAIIPPDASPQKDPLLEEARRLSAEGKLREAATLYTEWLAESSGHERFGMILIEAADSQLSVERALQLLRLYTPRVQDPRQAELCRASQVDLLQMLGRTEQALGLLRSFPATPQWLYRQAELLYQEGLADEAEKSLQQALKALLDDGNGEIDEEEARIRLLQARILAVQERHREADNLFQLLVEKYGSSSMGPGILLSYYEFLLALGRQEAAEEQAERLAREFPDSPELALARSKGDGQAIGYAPTPLRLLPQSRALTQDGADSMRDEGPAAVETAAVETAAVVTAVAPQPPDPQLLVQAGSFRDRENAQYMVRDLRTAGFEAAVVEKEIGDSLYFRVVIGPPMKGEQAQGVLMKLKDAGFEGVLLFPE